MKLTKLSWTLVVVGTISCANPCTSAPEFVQEAPKIDKSNIQPTLQGDINKSEAGPTLQQYAHFGFRCIRESKNDLPAKITEVAAGSPAALAKLAVNDLIIRVEKKGTALELEVERDGRTYLATVGTQKANPTPEMRGQAEVAARDNTGTVLQGRIERIGQADATLPLELTNGPVKLKGSISGFSNDMLGGWGGTLNTTYYTHSPGFENPYRQTGTNCKVVFFFTKSHGQISLKPPTLYFPRENRVLDSYRLASEAGTGKWAWEVPTEPLGNTEWVDKDSLREAEKDRVIHNTITKLKPGTVEQDLVSEISRPGKPLRYTEVVLRFTQVDRGLMMAQVAKVDYEANRVPFRKWLWEGMMSQNWEIVTVQIASLFRMSRTEFEQKYPEAATWLNNGSSKD